jgi:hypothetical protein
MKSDEGKALSGGGGELVPWLLLAGGRVLLLLGK